MRDSRGHLRRAIVFCTCPGCSCVPSSSTSPHLRLAMEGKTLRLTNVSIACKTPSKGLPWTKRYLLPTEADP